MARTHHRPRWNLTKQRKTEAINKLNPPTNTKTLKSSLGAIQCLAKFIPSLSEKTENLRQLLKKGTK